MAKRNRNIDDDKATIATMEAIVIECQHRVETVKIVFESDCANKSYTLSVRPTVARHILEVLNTYTWIAGQSETDRADHRETYLDAVTDARHVWRRDNGEGQLKKFIRQYLSAQSADDANTAAALGITYEEIEYAATKSDRLIDRETAE